MEAGTATISKKVICFTNGKPSGDWEVFAEGFAGIDSIPSAGDAKHRPVGLAQGPDGSLYVSDDAHGTIYRIIYNENNTSKE